MIQRAILAIASAFALFAPGCESTSTFTGMCQADSECPIGAFCRNGLCACRSNEACAEGEECNAQGICQKKTGCRSNTDCEDRATFCDYATGKCIPRTGCGIDVHCDPGTVCEPETGRCIDGCYADGDCQLYAVCSKGQGSGFETLGQCLRGVCADKSYCAYGELCVNGMCAPSGNPTHCQACDPQMQGSCGDAANFCLINPNYDPNNPQSGSSHFCGVDCASNPGVCPSGYGCGPVQLLTGDLCQPGAHSQCCQGRDPSECCPDGQRCDSKRVCVGGEGDMRGACTCLRNEDCSSDQVPAICAGVCNQVAYPPLCAGTCGGFGLRLCLQDSHCNGTRCVLDRNKRCQTPAGQACNADTDCQATPICSGGFCLNSPSPMQPVQCTGSQDCLCLGGWCATNGRRCTSGDQCLPACLQDSHCGAGGCNLNNRRCLNPLGQACSTDANCQTMPVCGEYAGRPGNVCWNSPDPNNPTACTSGGDCSCVPDMTGTKRCTSSGRVCNTSADCQLECRNGFCFLGMSCAPIEGLDCTDVR